MQITDGQQLASETAHAFDYGHAEGDGKAGWVRTMVASWYFPLLVGLVLVVMLHPLDGPLSRTLSPDRLAGDVRRELSAVQQFGQGTFSALIAVAILLLDRRMVARRLVIRWAVLAGVLAVTVTGLKMLVGRVRPRMLVSADPQTGAVATDPDWFLGPFGRYPLEGKSAGSVELTSAWQFWKKGVADVWSMPSSHTAFAMLCAVMLASLYPRIRWLAFGLAGTVAVCRLLFDAHYLTDVVAALCITLATVRLLDGPLNRWKHTSLDQSVP